MASTSTQELRFEFGKNWKDFLKNLNEHRIETAKKSLIEKLGVSSLAGKTFLDIGCGSGLFSLAAKRLGAEVFSFDYDQNSVDCAKALKNNFYPNDTLWTIEKGDILSKEYLNRFQTFDVVYSWGVLHHTGNLNQALENAGSLVKLPGLLFISIYNDQGEPSHRWKKIKEIYNGNSKVLRKLALFYTLFRCWAFTVIKDTLKFGNPLKTWREYSNDRGMSPWVDVVDWVGGYPFEVAKPEEIFDFYYSRGYELQRLKTCAGGLGCNEFVFFREKKYE
jgi:2-polyprenyl-3-methyl-5-hydroxy-6-metoxy-1,4-benzoquinol methylase